MNKFWEHIFYILSYLFQGASYLSPNAYAIMHREHHAFADTKKDPHSPKYDKNLFNMMWKTKNIYNDIYYKRVQVDPKFTKNLPNWPIIDKIGDSWISRISWGLLYLAFYLVFATSWWMFLLLPIHFLMGPVHGAIINWFAHKIGYRNYVVNDTSANLFPIEILMLGEGLHNNHHKNSSSPNFAKKWFEFDPLYPIILFLNLINVIQLKPK